jgi:hypothetical protein
VSYLISFIDPKKYWIQLEVMKEVKLILYTGGRFPFSFMFQMN